MARRQLKIVRLLEPELCLECRFAQTADVETANGSHQRMIYCRRLDCDNWDIVNAEPAMALFVPDDDPLVFYRALGEFAAQQIGTGAILFAEVHDPDSEVDRHVGQEGLA